MDDIVMVYFVWINYKVGFVEIFFNNKVYDYIVFIYDFIVEVNVFWYMF